MQTPKVHLLLAMFSECLPNTRIKLCILKNYINCDDEHHSLRYMDPRDKNITSYNFWMSKQTWPCLPTIQVRPHDDWLWPWEWVRRGGSITPTINDMGSNDTLMVCWEALAVGWGTLSLCFFLLGRLDCQSSFFFLFPFNVFLFSLLNSNHKLSIHSLMTLPPHRPCYHDASAYICYLSSSLSVHTPIL